MKVGTVALLARASALAVVGGLMMPQVALAQAASNEKQVTADIPAGALGPALESFGKKAGIAIVYPAEMVRGLSTDGVSGTMSVQVALARLLAGTGLAAQLSDGVVNLVKVGDGSAERVLGAVRVQGAQGNGLPGATAVNGVNGSRDVTATEGTGSYTSNALTVGSKVAASIKDTPMAVSVITNQQIQDRNITDLSSAMRDAPGVTVLNSGSDFAFWSRGFQITQIQIDGGAPQTSGVSDPTLGYTYRPIIDMSLYDHVELVRGATGTFNAYGNPGGVVNLVRKRPLDHSQMLIEMQLGSWNWHRVSADITGPIALGGRMRARVIGTHQDNEYFYDVSHANRNLVSATLELDISSSTLLTAGVNYQEQSGNAWGSGLPRFYDGSPLGLPRSTSLVFPQAINDASSFDYYGQIEQKFGPDWTLTFKGTRSRQKSWADLGAGASSLFSSGIDPVTHAGAQMGVPIRFNGRTKQTLLEATLNGRFMLFGQEQKVILGANYAMGDGAGTGQYNSRAGDGFIGKVDNFGYQVNVLEFDPNSWILTPSAYTIQSYGTDYADTRTMNAYLSVDLSPLRGFHINTSLRYSSYRSRALAWEYCADQGYVDYGLCAAVGDKYYYQAGALNKGTDFSWPPSISARYDFNRALTVYATYTDIYQNRSGSLDRDGKPLPPVTGMNFESGVKWLSPDRKLNANISAYYTKQTKTAVFGLCPDAALSCTNSTNFIGKLNDRVSCCYAVDPNSYNKSYGIDVELTGELRRGWQIAASYTFNRNEQVSPGAVYFTGATRALQSQSPRHLFKIWSTYEFKEGSPLSGAIVGLGANGQSRTFVETTRCTAFSTFLGQPWFCDTSVPVFFSDPGHVVFNASLGYKISQQLRIDAELENLADKTYYATVGDINGGNWYGSPRSIKITLRGKF